VINVADLCSHNPVCQTTPVDP